jgi:hypothetical protein
MYGFRKEIDVLMIYSMEFSNRIKAVPFILVPVLLLSILSSAVGSESEDTAENRTQSYTESRDPGGTGLLSSSDKEENPVENESDWLESADRLMKELLALDVRMYSLINSVANEDSRKALIRKRSMIRKLIYDLMAARNTVLDGTGDEQ